jgi:hypothetical protein
MFFWAFFHSSLARERKELMHQEIEKLAVNKKRGKRENIFWFEF